MIQAMNELQSVEARAADHRAVGDSDRMTGARKQHFMTAGDYKSTVDSDPVAANGGLAFSATEWLDDISKGASLCPNGGHLEKQIQPIAQDDRKKNRPIER